jgi:SAM-dependent methyltransferase
MAEKPWYKDWFNSPFYHKLYFQHDEQEARAFLAALIQHLQPAPASIVLDVGCGRGRHSRILAGMGFDVTGVDISFDSLRYAREFESDQLHFYFHDMRLPFWGNYFHLAFNLFTSFGYFRTRREHDDSIRTIAKSLRPGGHFVIDYLNVHFSEDHIVPNEKKEIDTTRFEIHRWNDEQHFYKKITITDPSLPSALEFTEKVAKFSLGDFTDMLSFQGLQVVQVFGDYSLKPYDVRKSPRMIVVAKKSS